ncbi:PG1 [Linum grandiflorum]
MKWSSSMAALLIAMVIMYGGISANAHGEGGVFDIMKYGAVSDGNTDICQALTKAWGDACKSPTPAKVLVPPGEFLAGITKLLGPCTAPIELEINGVIKAPKIIKGEDYILIEDVNDVKVFGTGTIDGQGAYCWENKDDRAPNIRFQNINNGWVEGLTSKDSKFFHMSTLYVKNLTFSHVHTIAPAESRNTDGIHISRSSMITVIDSIFETGDDCVSMADDLDTVTVRNIKCGPGHGVSIGSLGKYEKEKPVKNILIQNCTISNSDNGIRIKSWPERFATTLSDVHFEDIVFDNVENPIIIDQLYCPNNECNGKLGPSKVKISNVWFKNVKGTSKTKEVVQLICSSALPCENVQMCDVDITFNGGKGQAVCENVKPIVSGIVNPGC